MSAENQDQDFEKLQRLLKLKRHEQPPPRFFNDFSGKVTARLRAGDVGKLESLEDVVAQTPWLQRLWQAIEGKPAISGVFTAAVCGLIVAGAFFADKSQHELPTFNPVAQQNDNGGSETPRLLFAESPGVNFIPVSSTNPTAMLPGSLFNGSPMLQTFPAKGLPIPAGPR